MEFDPGAVGKDKLNSGFLVKLPLIIARSKLKFIGAGASNWEARINGEMDQICRHRRRQDTCVAWPSFPQEADSKKRKFDR
ncbi:hypothetical protein Nepgr_019434 [Nepenthes gracilis]|uniref:Uncharacterized protein n=1 Tax=Nepenthes gracilis TaxID=150966 RepID=A0AAD3XUD4_NEPGR|nr:hypothetical protein Nepgr_019434 [Nepenthes gracilis]